MPTLLLQHGSRPLPTLTVACRSMPLVCRSSRLPSIGGYRLPPRASRMGKKRSLIRTYMRPLPSPCGRHDRPHIHTHASFPPITGIAENAYTHASFPPTMAEATDLYTNIRPLPPPRGKCERIYIRASSSLHHRGEPRTLPST